MASAEVKQATEALEAMRLAATPLMMLVQSHCLLLLALLPAQPIRTQGTNASITVIASYSC